MNEFIDNFVEENIIERDVGNKYTKGYKWKGINYDNIGPKFNPKNKERKRSRNRDERRTQDYDFYQKIHGEEVVHESNVYGSDLRRIVKRSMGQEFLLKYDNLKLEPRKLYAVKFVSYSVKDADDKKRHGFIMQLNTKETDEDSHWVIEDNWIMLFQSYPTASSVHSLRVILGLLKQPLEPISFEKMLKHVNVKVRRKREKRKRFKFLLAGLIIGGYVAKYGLVHFSKFIKWRAGVASSGGTSAHSDEINKYFGS